MTCAIRYSSFLVDYFSKRSYRCVCVDAYSNIRPLLFILLMEEHQSKQQQQHQLEKAMINLRRVFLNWRLFKRCLLACYCVCIKGWWRWSTFLSFLYSERVGRKKEKNCHRHFCLSFHHLSTVCVRQYFYFYLFFITFLVVNSTLDTRDRNCSTSLGTNSFIGILWKKPSPSTGWVSNNFFFLFKTSSDTINP